MANSTISYIYLNNYSNFFSFGEAVDVTFDQSYEGGVPNYLEYSLTPNQWFTKCESEYDSERELIKVLQMESYNLFGVSVIYYKTTYDTDYNRIWGEDRNRLITQYWNGVMSYFNFPREDKIWSKFGIEGLENVTMYFSKEHFDSKTDSYIPKMGDLIQTPYNSSVYEVVEIKEEEGMYLLSKEYTWEVIVRPFKDEMLVLSGDTIGSPLSAYTNLPSDSDIFDIKSDVDVKKEDIIYEDSPEEKSNNDPWGNW